MMIAGSIAGNSLTPNSMARAIEDEMVNQGLIDLDDESEDEATQRRKTLVAIATGVINHIVARMEINVPANTFETGIPAVAKTLDQVS